MDFEVIPATQEALPIFVQLWPLYQYDLSVVGGVLPNSVGLFEDEGIWRVDYADDLRVWFQRPGHLFPYLIRVDGRAAGLVMIGGAPSNAPKGADFFVHEFFLMRPFRGQGVAAGVMGQLFQRHLGKWELWVIPENVPALRFWRKVIAAEVGAAIAETQEYKPSWESEAVVMRFRNAGQ